jgi:hypothetical protein
MADTPEDEIDFPERHASAASTEEIDPQEFDADRPEPLDQEYPPLDAVNSRWWYWIAAYPLVNLLFVPLAGIGAFLFFVPLFVVSGPAGPGGPLGPRAAIPILGLVLLLVTLVVSLMTLLSLVLLPIALYLDARAVAKAHLDWEPDPLLYALLGLLQFFVTPIVGVAVAVYYLYRRHEYVGVP